MYEWLHCEDVEKHLDHGCVHTCNETAKDFAVNLRKCDLCYAVQLCWLNLLAIMYLPFLCNGWNSLFIF